MLQSQGSSRDLLKPSRVFSSLAAVLLLLALGTWHLYTGWNAGWWHVKFTAKCSLEEKWYNQISVVLSLGRQGDREILVMIPTSPELLIPEPVPSLGVIL